MSENQNPTSPTPVAPPYRKPANLEIYGVENQNLDDRKITFAVMLQVIAKTEGREVLAVIPSYEIPLMRRMYARLGGSVTTSADWLFSKSGAEAIARIRPLSREEVGAEMTRLASSYAFQTNAERVSVFEQVYGKGLAGFFRAVSASAKQWRTLSEKLKAEKRQNITHEEAEALASLSDPVEQRVGEDELVDQFTLQDAKPAATPDTGASVEDALGEIGSDLELAVADALAEKGIPPEVISEVCTLAAKGKVTQAMLADLPALRGKKDQILGIMQAVTPVLRDAKTKKPAGVDSSLA